MSICGTEVPDESILVAGGKLENVVVTIEGAAAKTEPGTITLDQHKCRYVPHVQAAPVGSSLDILNSDGMLHNIHGYLGTATIFNLAMPLKDQKLTRKLTKGGLVRLKCDVHSWMSGWIVVTDSPVGVSDKNGTFVVRNVPAGTYTATAWHEKLGQQTAQVTVPASGEATVSFTFGK
jgi:plastocyanin